MKHAVQSGMASYARRYEHQILPNIVGSWFPTEPKHTLLNNGYSFSDSVLGAEVSAFHQTKLWPSCIHLPSSHPKIHPNIISTSLWSSRGLLYTRFPEPEFCIYSLSPYHSHIPSWAQPCRFHLQFSDCFVIILATSIQYFPLNSTVKPS
jgi:hypothetical protein